MDHVYSAGYDAQHEIVINVDLEYDLWAAGLLLDIYGVHGQLSDAEAERQSEENERRVGLFAAAFRDSLAEIGEERQVTIYLGDASEATRTPINEDGDTLEREIWQEAHDRTPAEPLWTGDRSDAGTDT